MTLPDPLRPGEYPLMPGDLVARYNGLLALLCRVEDQVPRLADAVDAQGEPLAFVRGRLQRERFPVGFLGRTQIGKSTTFNNLLKVTADKERRVSEEGNGDSTTSVATRLRAKGSRPDEVWLHYLAPEGYQAKRDMMCESLGLDPKADDATILRQLPELEKQIEGGEKQAQIQNPRYLRRLLLSYAQHKALLGTPPTLGVWKDRFNYLNHDVRSDRPSPYLLLEDARVEYHTDAIHPDMEMIDVPGLGDKVKAITEAAIKRLGDLDGALVFVDIRQRADPCAEEVFTYLRQAYKGDFKDRVWIVFVRCDGFDNNFTRGPAPAHENGFDAVVRMVTGHKVPLDQVYLITNKLDLFRRDKGRDPVPIEVDTLIGFARDTTPDGLEKQQELREAFTHLYDDGGLERLRDLLVRTLPPKVKRRTEEWVRERMREVCRKVEGQLEFAKSQSNHDLLPAVNEALAAVRKQLKELTTPGPRFEAPIRAMREELRKHFTLHFADDERNDRKPLADVRVRYPDDAGRLDNLLMAQFRREAEAMYDQVGRAFAGLPSLPILDRPSIEEAWKHLAEQDARSPAWAGPAFPRFRDDRLFAGIHEDEADRIDGKCYRRLMTEKVNASTRSILHLVRWKIVGRLEELERTLDALTRIKPDDGRGGPVNYDEMLSTLRSLCP